MRKQLGYTFTMENLAPEAQTDIVASPFYAPLEAAAPGIAAVIRAQTSPGEKWAQALQRLLPSLNATPEQREYLLAQSERALTDQAPLPAPAGTGSEPAFPAWGWWAIGAGLFFLTRRRR